MAIKSQGAILAVETARAAAKTITGATAASPGVVTAVAHGYSNGDIVYIDGVVGMVQLNGRAFVVASVTTDTFELKGADTSAYTAYASGGSAYKATMTAIGSVRDVNATGGSADDIDVTHLQSVTKEFLIGLSDEGDATFNVWVVNADTGQAALRTARESQATKVFTVTDSAGLVSCFPGQVKQFGFNIAQNGAVEASVAVKITAAKAWFA